MQFTLSPNQRTKLVEKIDLTPEQEAFLSTTGKVVLKACPGSGKTYLVARKLTDLLKTWKKKDQGIATLSFTNVASIEIERQVRSISGTGSGTIYPHFNGTLDSFINNFIFLRFGYLLFKDQKRPKIYIDQFSQDYQYWRRECRQKGCVEGFNKFRWSSLGLLDHTGHLVSCPPNRYQKYPPCEEFKRILLEKGIVFQNEVAFLSLRLMEKYKKIASAVTSRFPVLILDEAQDTSFDQMALIDLLVENGLPNVYLVGDPDQAIYEWRDATPECFIKKFEDPTWNGMELTHNFRSSQFICNVTKHFSNTLSSSAPNASKGENPKFPQKPILLLFDDRFETIQADIVQWFLDKSKDLGIPITSDNLAVVTRARVHKETDIKDLWKSREIELLARASYEFVFGSRKIAFDSCEKALYQLTIGNIDDVVNTIEDEVTKIMPYQDWKTIILDLLVKLPSSEKILAEWVTTLKKVTEEILATHGLTINGTRVLNNVIKIKNSDNRSSTFKEIPVKKFFEKTIKTEYTRSSVHGVKGETYDGILLLIPSRNGKITPGILQNGDLNSEEMRIAYVAMTRPRKLLVVAMPRNKKTVEYQRFSRNDWEYITF